MIVLGAINIKNMDAVND